MKIACVSSYNYPKVNISHKVNFKSHVDWFDDEPLSPLFESLLEHAYAARGVAYTGSTSTVPDTSRLEDVGHNIMNFRILGNSSYSGESLARKPEYFKILGNSGVTNIIDLINNPKLKEYCDKHGLDYYSYDMNWGYGGQALLNDEENLIKEYSNNLCQQGLNKKEYDETISAYKSKLAKEKTSAVCKLKNLINEVNKGHFYMSCEYGEYRTVNCLALVSIFNPEWYGEKIAPATTEFAKKIQNMFKNLTSEHKQILGLNEDYCKYLSGHIEKLVKTI